MSGSGSLPVKEWRRQPLKSTDSEEVLYNSSHSSFGEATVPIQAISLMTTLLPVNTGSCDGEGEGEGDGIDEGEGVGDGDDDDDDDDDVGDGVNDVGDGVGDGDNDDNDDDELEPPPPPPPVAIVTELFGPLGVPLIRPPLASRAEGTPLNAFQFVWSSPRLAGSILSIESLPEVPPAYHGKPEIPTLSTR